jgi:UDP-N-acetylglucosamine acyltransferase
VIDEHAIIDSTAKIAKNVSIGPYSIIGPNVEIGEGCVIESHVVINGRTKIGCNNKIFPFASIGEDPQDLSYKGEDTILEIGDNNTIREFCTLNRGTVKGGGVTKIGNNNLIMAYVHIAHDCKVGSNTIFANNASLSGHVVVNDHALLGGFAGIAQYCNIGAYSFVAAQTGINKDVLPYVIVSSYHEPAKTYGLNVVGLKRKGFSLETIKKLRQAYHLLCKENLTVKDILPKLEVMAKDCPAVQLFIDAIVRSKHGIIR